MHASLLNQKPHGSFYTCIYSLFTMKILEMNKSKIHNRHKTANSQSNTTTHSGSHGQTEHHACHTKSRDTNYAADQTKSL